MKYSCSVLLFLILCLPASYAQLDNGSNPWKFNSGFDIGAWWGGTGMSSLKAASNPLIKSDFSSQTAYSGDIYLEWLHRKSSNANEGPGLGIKTKVVWDWFTANNGGTGNGYESVTLNYINIPVLLEYCLSFKNKVTVSHYVPGSSNTQIQVYEHSYGDHIVGTTTTTPGGFTQGGIPFSNAIFIYAGPQIAFLTKGYHNINGSGSENTISDPNFKNNYIGLIGGFCFYLGKLNIDVSYQKGLTSVYNGQSLYINGFLGKLGFNLSRRKY